MKFISHKYFSPLLFLGFFLFSVSGLSAQEKSVPERSTRGAAPEPAQRKTERKKDGENRFLYAQMLLEEGHYKRSRELLEDFLILFPAHPRRLAAMRHLGSIAEKQKKFETALRIYIQTYNEGSGQEVALQAYLLAGRLAARLGKIEQAHKIFKEMKRGKHL